MKLLPRRGQGGFPSAWRTLLFVAVATTVAAAVAVLPEREASEQVIRTVSEVGERGPAGAEGGQGGGVRTTRRLVGGGGALAACPGNRNDGATDVGVTGTSVKLGATVVDSGIGASFLRHARFGMLAVRDAVNRAGGVCGRRLELNLVDDGWDFQRGGEFIRNLVEDKKVFALAVVPSSEGLKNVSDAGYLRKNKVPVVGSDGMLIHQYTDPWIWPVAASTISTMHIMAKHAYDVFKAKNFAIVYESTYHFGIEGAFAFNEAYKRLTGRNVPGYSNPLTNPRCERRFCGINAGQPSYATDIQTLNRACTQETPQCDFIALLLEPATALTWLKGGAVAPGGGWRTGAVQPLFTRKFAEECAETCNRLWLWTGYQPPIGANLGKPDVAQYVRDVSAVSTSADLTNSFTEGAYVGMQFLVQGLQQVGGNLTRERLKETLDRMSYESGLVPPLRFRPGNHFANVSMRAYSIQYKDRFAGWRDERTEFKDPWVGQDIP